MNTSRHDHQAALGGRWAYQIICTVLTLAAYASPGIVWYLTWKLLP